MESVIKEASLNGSRNSEETNYQPVVKIEPEIESCGLEETSYGLLPVKCEYESETSGAEDNEPVPSPILPLVEIKVEENWNDGDDNSKDQFGTFDRTNPFFENTLAVTTNTVHEPTSICKSDKQNKKSTFARKTTKKINQSTPTSNLELLWKSSSDNLDEPRHKCDKCSATFLYLSRLKSHMLNHDGERPYSCDQCKMTFKLKGNLATHQISHVDDRPFLCSDCGRSFKMKTTLQKHRKIHNTGAPGAAQQQDEAEEQQQVTDGTDEGISRKKKIKCPYCDMSFNSSFGLSVHLVIHTGERPHKCRFCDETFTQKGHLHHHLRLRHPGLKHHTCPLCGLDFEHLAELKEHNKFCSEQHGMAPKRRIARKVDHKCDACSAVFAFRTRLLLHKTEVHGDDRPFGCTECNQSFKKKSHLDKHNMLHSGDRPYVCRECGNAFTQRSHLRTHQRTHSGERPYKCDVCGAGFFQNCHLKAHKFLHTGKPFICGICNKGFCHKHRLRGHEKIHKKLNTPDSLREKYECALCTKAFISKTQLIDHFENNH
ncbi:zinc finger protein 300-like [Bacillus rossius redtenbacheri]|uniref:zinc finger protein 300-like n=1 Tax=Bacillus rossius redtenbacheri TaxID=93214 RepID=UPI002FDE957A